MIEYLNELMLAQRSFNVGWIEYLNDRIKSTFE